MPGTSLPQDKNYEGLPRSILTKDAEPFVLAVVSVVVLVLSLPALIAVMIATLWVYAVRDYDSRILIGAGLSLLPISFVLFALGSFPTASNVLVGAYVFLIGGVISLLLHYLRTGTGD